MNSTDMKYAMQKPCRVYSLPAVIVVLLARCDQSAASSSVITIPRFSSERRHFLLGAATMAVSVSDHRKPDRWHQQQPVTRRVSYRKESLPPILR